MTDAQGYGDDGGRSVGAAGHLALGRALRALRRRGDLSQRELAARAGLSQATLARIESGRADNPSFRTVERLVRGAGGAVSFGDLPDVPHDRFRDAAGRRYPAHLDVEEVTSPEQWWGAWWAATVVRCRWPLDTVPDVTFDLNRHRRDQRRAHAARAARVTVTPVADAPSARGGQLWEAVADGRRIGALSASRRNPFPDHHDGGRDCLVLDAVAVAPDWRRFGVGRRLVDAARSAAASAAVPLVALADGYVAGTFLGACGLRPAGGRPVRWLVSTG